MFRVDRPMCENAFRCASERRCVCHQVEEGRPGLENKMFGRAFGSEFRMKGHPRTYLDRHETTGGTLTAT